MAWPNDDLTNDHLDDASDDPSQARAELNAAVLKIKAIIAGAVSISTALTVVLRDASGNFAAAIITAVKFVGDVAANDGTVILDSGTNGSDATITADLTGDSEGTHTGDVVGNASSSNSCSGNAATSTSTSSLLGSSWADVHGEEVFNSGGTFTVPANVHLIFVSMQGGGGGGGTAGFAGRAGGGGSAGGHLHDYAMVVTPAAELPVTLGAAGTTGVAGGATVFNSITAKGGGAGGPGNSGGNGAGGAVYPGVGASGKGGDFAEAGGNTNFYNGGTGLNGGGGGASIYGAGGNGGGPDQVGSSATGYGAGGGGGHSTGGAARAGGAGTAGKVVIRW